MMSAYISKIETDSFLLLKGNDYKYVYALAFLVDWLKIDCHYWRNSASSWTFWTWSVSIGALWSNSKNNNNDNPIKIQHATFAIKQTTVNQYWVMLSIWSAKSVSMHDHWVINDIIYLGYLGQRLLTDTNFNDHFSNVKWSPCFWGCISYPHIVDNSTSNLQQYVTWDASCGFLIIILNIPLQPLYFNSKLIFVILQKCCANILNYDHFSSKIGCETLWLFQGWSNFIFAYTLLSFTS